MNWAQYLNRVVLCFGVALALYVLSVGPATRFWCGGRWTRTVNRVWFPVMALDDTAARPVYRAYLRLWGIRIVDLPVQY